MTLLRRDKTNFNDKIFQELDAYISFKDACLENRMLLNNDFLDWLSENIKSLETIISKGYLAYRARVYKANTTTEQDDV